MPSHWETDEFSQVSPDDDPSPAGKPGKSGKCGREANARKCAKWRRRHISHRREWMRRYMAARRSAARLSNALDA